MSEPHTPLVVLRSALTASDRAQLDALVAACSQHDGADWSIVTSLATTYDGALPQPGYVRDGTLLGLVALQAPDAALEAIVLVHPAHRRRGIGRTLLAAVRTAAHARAGPGRPADVRRGRAGGRRLRARRWGDLPRLRVPDGVVGAGRRRSSRGTTAASSASGEATLPEFARINAAAFGSDEEGARTRSRAPSTGRG